MKRAHDRIEAIAGAIALGEATDEERHEYRQHLSSCPSCLNELGGEREIERVSHSVMSARDSEIWQPAVDPMRAPSVRRMRIARYASAAAGLCVLAAVGLHFGLPAGTAHASVKPRIEAAFVPYFHAAGDRHHAAFAAQLPAQTPVQRRLMVVHNVVNLARAPVADPAAPPAAAKRESKPPEIATIVVHPDVAPPKSAPAQSNVPVWRRDDPPWHTVARTTTTSVSEMAPPSFTQNAESIRMVHPQVVRDASPIGGETAITPQPPMMAFDEQAEGTTVFEVVVDEQGAPKQCVITRTSGYQMLDDSVCKAAMQARYSPKTVDGKPVAGTYHDAFTFRMSSNQ